MNTFLILISNCFIFTGGDVVPGAQDVAAGHGIGQADENEEVMRALLIHEKRGAAGAGGGGASTATKGLVSATANASDSESDTSESDDDSPLGPPPATATQHRAAEEEEEDDDEFEDVGDEPMVMVGGRQFSYREVSQRPELVEQMSAQEKEAYIEMGRNLFQDMYFWAHTLIYAYINTHIGLAMSLPKVYFCCLTLSVVTSEEMFVDNFSRGNQDAAQEVFTVSFLLLHSKNQRHALTVLPKSSHL